MTDETLHDLMLRVGLVRDRPSPWAAQRPRPLPRRPQQPYRSAFWDAPETNQLQQLPSQALGNPNTLPMSNEPTLGQRQQRNDMAQFALQHEAARNEVNTPPGTYIGQDALEMTGLPSVARGIGHLRDQEPGQALPELAMGGLGVAGMFGAGGARTPRPRPPLRAALPELAAEAPRLPNAPARLPGRATDGSVLPIRPPQPIRQSMVGGSNDLAEAAAMRPQQAPDAGSGGAGQEGFNFDEPLYHGTSGAIEGEFIPSRGLELGNGVYVTPDAEFASQHATKHNQGGAVVPLYARQGRYATGEQYRNALDNVGNGRNHDATQAYLESRGYIGVRDGREIVVFRPENLTFRTQSPDGGSAQTGRSLADRVLNVEPAPTLRQAIAERVNPSPQSVIEPPAPTRIQPDAGGVQEGFGTTPFYRGAVHDVDTSQGPNQLAFFTPSREFAGEFPRALPAEQRRVGEYRLRGDQLADFRNPETQQRVLAELADDADATDHLRRRIAQMRDKATGHIDWVISADPAIRDAIERAGYSGMWLDEGGGQASVAVFRNSDIRPASAQPDGGSAQTGLRGFHGSQQEGLTELRPGERGPMGPATYLSPYDMVAGRYGPNLYEADVPNIFHGLGSSGFADSSINPYEVWRTQLAQLLDAAEPARRAEIAAIAERMHPQDGYPFFRRLVNLYGSEEAAQALFRRAGFDGISGHVDGPEIAVFGNLPVRNGPNAGPPRPPPRTLPRRQNAQPDGGASGAGNFAWTDDNFTLAGDGGQIRGRLWTNGETGEQALKIDSSATLRPGTGQGVPLYIQAFQEAQRRGLPLVSDQRVSLSASHVYDALARRGYRVERNPTAEQVRGHWVSRDGDPVFRVTDAPNAGSPRTPPRTPPRPRPPRRQQ